MARRGRPPHCPHLKASKDREENPDVIKSAIGSNKFQADESKVGIDNNVRNSATEASKRTRRKSMREKVSPQSIVSRRHNQDFSNDEDVECIRTHDNDIAAKSESDVALRNRRRTRSLTRATDVSPLRSKLLEVANEKDILDKFSLSSLRENRFKTSSSWEKNLEKTNIKNSKCKWEGCSECQQLTCHGFCIAHYQKFKKKENSQVVKEELEMESTEERETEFSPEKYSFICTPQKRTTTIGGTPLQTRSAYRCAQNLKNHSTKEEGRKTLDSEHDLGNHAKIFSSLHGDTSRQTLSTSQYMKNTTKDKNEEENGMKSDVENNLQNDTEILSSVQAQPKLGMKTSSPQTPLTFRSAKNQNNDESESKICIHSCVENDLESNTKISSSMRSQRIRSRSESRIGIKVLKEKGEEKRKIELAVEINEKNDGKSSSSGQSQRKRGRGISLPTRSTLKSAKKLTKCEGAEEIEVEINVENKLMNLALHSPSTRAQCKPGKSTSVQTRSTLRSGKNMRNDGNEDKRRMESYSGNGISNGTTQLLSVRLERKRKQSVSGTTPQTCSVTESRQRSTNNEITEKGRLEVDWKSEIGCHTLEQKERKRIRLDKSPSPATRSKSLPEKNLTNDREKEERDRMLADSYNLENDSIFSSFIRDQHKQIRSVPGTSPQTRSQSLSAQIMVSDFVNEIPKNDSVKMKTKIPQGRPRRTRSSQNSLYDVVKEKVGIDSSEDNDFDYETPKLSSVLHSKWGNTSLSRSISPEQNHTKCLVEREIKMKLDDQYVMGNGFESRSDKDSFLHSHTGVGVTPLPQSTNRFHQSLMNDAAKEKVMFDIATDSDFENETEKLTLDRAKRGRTQINEQTTPDTPSISRSVLNLQNKKSTEDKAKIESANENDHEKEFELSAQDISSIQAQPYKMQTGGFNSRQTRSISRLTRSVKNNEIKEVLVESSVKINSNSQNKSSSLKYSHLEEIHMGDGTASQTYTPLRISQNLTNDSNKEEGRMELASENITGVSPEKDVFIQLNLVQPQMQSESSQQTCPILLPSQSVTNTTTVKKKFQEESDVDDEMKNENDNFSEKYSSMQPHLDQMEAVSIAFPQTSRLSMKLINDSIENKITIEQSIVNDQANRTETSLESPAVQPHLEQMQMRNEPSVTTCITLRQSQTLTNHAVQTELAIYDETESKTESSIEKYSIAQSHHEQIQIDSLNISQTCSTPYFSQNLTGVENELLTESTGNNELGNETESSFEKYFSLQPHSLTIPEGEVEFCQNHSPSFYGHNLIDVVAEKEMNEVHLENCIKLEHESILENHFSLGLNSEEIPTDGGTSSPLHLSQSLTGDFIENVVFKGSSVDNDLKNESHTTLDKSSSLQIQSEVVQWNGKKSLQAHSTTCSGQNMVNDTEVEGMQIESQCQPQKTQMSDNIMCSSAEEVMIRAAAEKYFMAEHESKLTETFSIESNSKKIPTDGDTFSQISSSLHPQNLKKDSIEREFVKETAVDNDLNDKCQSTLENSSSIQIQSEKTHTNRRKTLQTHSTTSSEQYILNDTEDEKVQLEQAAEMDLEFSKENNLKKKCHVQFQPQTMQTSVLNTPKANVVNKLTNGKFFDQVVYAPPQYGSADNDLITPEVLPQGYCYVHSNNNVRSRTLLESPGNYCKFQGCKKYNYLHCDGYCQQHFSEVSLKCSDGHEKLLNLVNDKNTPDHHVSVNDNHLQSMVDELSATNSELQNGKMLYEVLSPCETNQNKCNVRLQNLSDSSHWTCQCGQIQPTSQTRCGKCMFFHDKAIIDSVDSVLLRSEKKDDSLAVSIEQPLVIPGNEMNMSENLSFDEGDVVFSNSHGAARVIKVYPAGDNTQKKYDVVYLLGGLEKGLDGTSLSTYSLDCFLKQSSSINSFNEAKQFNTSTFQALEQKRTSGNTLTPNFEAHFEWKCSRCGDENLSTTHCGTCHRDKSTATVSKTSMLEQTRYELLSGHDCWICTTCAIMVSSLTLACGMCGGNVSFVPLEMQEFKTFIKEQRRKKNYVWLHEEVQASNSENIEMTSPSNAIKAARTNPCRYKGCLDSFDAECNGFCQSHYNLTTSSILVKPEDQALINDYYYLLLEQMQPCYLTEQDKLLYHNDRVIGDPGLTCRHCEGLLSGHAHRGRFFPASSRSISAPSFFVNKLAGHLHTCKACPDEIKNQMMSMEITKSHFHDKEEQNKKRDGQRLFFQRLWCHLLHFSQAKRQKQKLKGCIGSLGLNSNTLNDTFLEKLEWCYLVYNYEETLNMKDYEVHIETFQMPDQTI